jgi:hypothetical protein
VVAEKCIQFDNVGMGEEALDFDLSDELDKNFLVDVKFIDPLNSTDEPRLFVLSNKNFPKLACP